MSFVLQKQEFCLVLQQHLSIFDMQQSPVLMDFQIHRIRDLKYALFLGLLKLFRS